MSKTVHSVKLQAYDSVDLDRLSYSNGDLVYDLTSGTIRLMDGVSQGGKKLATQTWTTTVLNAYVTNSNLNTALSSYATTASLSTYVITTTLNSYATLASPVFQTNIDGSATFTAFASPTTLKIGGEAVTSGQLFSYTSNRSATNLNIQFANNLSGGAGSSLYAGMFMNAGDYSTVRIGDFAGTSQNINIGYQSKAGQIINIGTNLTGGTGTQVVNIGTNNTGITQTFGMANFTGNNSTVGIGQFSGTNQAITIGGPGAGINQIINIGQSAGAGQYIFLGAYPAANQTINIGSSGGTGQTISIGENSGAGQTISIGSTTGITKINGINIKSFAIAMGAGLA
jgi:hypothetical protein